MATEGCTEPAQVTQEGIYSYNEDEINLLDLFMVLLKHKFLIICIVFLSAYAAAMYSLTLNNIYKSEASIIPRKEEKSPSPLPILGGYGVIMEQLGFAGGGSLQRLDIVLKSRGLTDRVINKYHLMPILFPKEEWKSKSYLPTIQDGWKKMQTLFKSTIDKDKNAITISIEHKYPYTANRIVEYYLIELSETLREDVLRDAHENIRFFDQQLKETSDVLLKDKINSLLAREIEKQTFAKAQKYYSFEVVDPPYMPDINKKVKPKRAIIIIISTVGSFFAAIFFAFFIEFIHQIKIKDPERYQKIVCEFIFWKRRNAV